MLMPNILFIFLCISCKILHTWFVIMYYNVFFFAVFWYQMFKTDDIISLQCFFFTADLVIRPKIICC